MEDHIQCLPCDVTQLLSTFYRLEMENFALFLLLLIIVCILAYLLLKRKHSDSGSVMLITMLIGKLAEVDKEGLLEIMRKFDPDVTDIVKAENAKEEKDKAQ